MSTSYVNMSVYPWGPVARLACIYFKFHTSMLPPVYTHGRAIYALDHYLHKFYTSRERMGPQALN